MLLAQMIIESNSISENNVASAGARCLASIWFLTMVDSDWYPHVKHCHLPPPRLLIREENLSETFKTSLLINSMLSTQMIVISTSISDNGIAMRTSVDLCSLKMFGFNMISDISGLGLVATPQTLPSTSTKICHHGLYCN